MKRKIVALILLAGLILMSVPVFAETIVFGEDYSKRIDVSDFKYILKDSLGEVTDTLVSGGTLSVSLQAKRTAGGTGSQPCTLVVTVYNGGKLYATKIASATALEDGTPVTIALADPITLPSDVSKLRIYTYLWTDILNPKILARPAAFGSPVNTLSELAVNNTALNIDEAFDEGDTFSYELDKIPAVLPVVSAKPDDLGAKVEITNVSALPGTATVNVTAQNGDVKTYNIDFSVKAKERVVADAITDDTNSRTNQYLTNYSPTGLWMQTNLYNGVPMNNNFNGTLKRAMIQVDVTKFPDDVSLIKNVYLTVTGQCNYNAGHLTAYCPSEFTVNAYDFTGYEWSESTVNASSSSVGPTLNEVVAKTPFDSFIVEKTDSTAGPWVEKSVNIKDLIVRAKENGNSKITVVLLADNSSRNTPELAALKNQNSNNRDELMFVMGTRENTTESRRPKVIIEEYEREE